MLALVLKDKKKQMKVFYFKSEAALNKKLSKSWRMRATAQIFEITGEKTVKAIPVKGLWNTKV